MVCVLCCGLVMVLVDFTHIFQGYCTGTFAFQFFPSANETTLMNMDKLKKYRNLWRADNITTIKQSTTQPCAHSMACTAWSQRCETPRSGNWFNIKVPSYLIENPIMEIWSYDRLISTMGFPLLVRWQLYIESGPWWCWKALHLLCFLVTSNEGW